MFEADDVIASLAKQHEGKVIIHSRDRDMHACLEDGRVTICKKSNTPEKGAALELEYLTEKMLLKQYGFLAESWTDYQILVGGKDNVSGWDGVGSKKAVELIRACVDLETIDVNACPVALNKTQVESYEEFRKHLSVIRQVRTIRTDLALPLNMPLGVGT